MLKKIRLYMEHVRSKSGVNLTEISESSDVSIIMIFPY